MNQDLPNAKSAHPGDSRERLRKIVRQRNLCGAANDTKWNELITEMRIRGDQAPLYRCRCLDGPPSAWDGEWYYHLPFPMISVEWLDIQLYRQERAPFRMDRQQLVDDSEWLENLLKQIGLDHRKGKKMIRVFGYIPRSVDFFDEE